MTWNDPILHIDWQLDKEPTISAKHLGGQDFHNARNSGKSLRRIVEKGELPKLFFLAATR